MTPSTSTPTTTKEGNTSSNPVDLTDSASSNVSGGEKRKAPTFESETKGQANLNTEEGGKDLIEKKQTTLDDVVSHEVEASSKVEKAKSGTGHGTESSSAKEDKEGKGEEERPSKKAKIEEGKEEKVNEGIKVDKESSSSGNKKPATTTTNGNGDGNETSTSTSTTAKADLTPANSASAAKEETTPSKPTSESTKPTPADDSVKTPAAASTTTSAAAPAGASALPDDTVPGDESHLDHPENWATGGDPATEKQKGFLKVLEKQKGVEVGNVDGIGKSKASEKIDELKNM